MSRRGSNRAYSISSLGLGPLSLNRGEVHPEEWTLVGVHKMEKRESYDSWMMDLQASILNCARRITGLLEVCPHPNADITQEEIAYAQYSIDWEVATLRQRVYHNRIPPPPMPHRVVTMTLDNINPGVRYY